MKIHMLLGSVCKCVYVCMCVWVCECVSVCVCVHVHDLWVCVIIFIIYHNEDTHVVR